MNNLPENFKDRKICVMGLGYVGLTFAVTLADIGFEVYGVEINEDTLNTLKKGSLIFLSLVWKEL